MIATSQSYEQRPWSDKGALELPPPEGGHFHIKDAHMPGLWLENPTISRTIFDQKNVTLERPIFPKIPPLIELCLL